MGFGQTENKQTFHPLQAFETTQDNQPLLFHRKQQKVIMILKQVQPQRVMNKEKTQE